MSRATSVSVDKKNRKPRIEPIPPTFRVHDKYSEEPIYTTQSRSAPKSVPRTVKERILLEPDVLRDRTKELDFIFSEPVRPMRAAEGGQSPFERVGTCLTKKKPMIKLLSRPSTLRVNQHGLSRDVQSKLPRCNFGATPRIKRLLRDDRSNNLTGARNRKVALTLDDQFFIRQHVIRVASKRRAILSG